MALEKTVKINFGSANYVTDTAYNNMTQVLNEVIDPALSLNETDGLTDSGWTCEVVDNDFAVSTANSVGNTSTHFGSDSLDQSYRVPSGTVAGIKIDGLNASNTYDIYACYSMLASGTPDNASKYTIGSDVQILDNYSNATTEASWTSVSPTSGAITIYVETDTGSSNARLAALHIEEYSGDAPASLLDATFNQTSSNVGHPQANGEIVRAGGTITFQANKTDADSYSYTIYDQSDGSTVGTYAGSATGEYIHTFSTIGEYAVKLQVTVGVDTQTSLLERGVTVTPSITDAATLDISSASTQLVITNGGDKKTSILIDGTRFTGTNDHALVLSGSRNDTWLFFKDIIGTAANPYIITNSGEVTINKNNGPLIYFENCEYVYLDGFGTDSITGSTNNPLDLGFNFDLAGNRYQMVGFYTYYDITQPMDHIYISGCNFHGGKFVTQLKPYGKDVISTNAKHVNDYTWHHNYFHNLSTEGFYLGDFAGMNPSRLDSVPYGGFKKWTFHRNKFYDIQLDAIQLSWAPDGDIEIHNNDFTKVGYGPSSVGAIEIHCSIVSMNSGFGGRIFNNFSNSCLGGMVMSNQSTMPVYFYNNVFLNHMDGYSQAVDFITVYWHDYLDISDYSTYGLNASNKEYVFNNVIHSKTPLNSQFYRVSDDTNIDEAKVFNNILVADGNYTVTNAVTNTSTGTNYFKSQSEADDIQFQYTGLTYDSNLTFPGYKDSTYDDKIRGNVEDTSPVLDYGTDLDTETMGDAPDTGIFPGYHDSFRDYTGYQTPIGTDWQAGAHASPGSVQATPSAQIVADKTSVGLNEEFTLDGSGSTNATTYSWDLGQNYVITSGSLTSSIVSLYYTAIGTYNPELTVADDDANTDDATASITVNVVPSDANTPLLYSIYNVTGGYREYKVVNNESEIDYNNSPSGSGDTMDPDSVIMEWDSRTSQLDGEKIPQFDGNSTAKSVLNVNDIYKDNDGYIRVVY